MIPTPRISFSLVSLACALIFSSSLSGCGGDDSDSTGTAGTANNAGSSNAGSGNSNAGSGNSNAGSGNSNADCDDICAQHASCPSFDTASCLSACDGSNACASCIADSAECGDDCVGVCSGGSNPNESECDPNACEQACIDGLVCRQSYQDNFPQSRDACITDCMEYCGNDFFDDQDAALFVCIAEDTDGACFDNRYQTCCDEYFTSELCD